LIKVKRHSPINRICYVSNLFPLRGKQERGLFSSFGETGKGAFFFFWGNKTGGYKGGLTI